MVWGVRPVRQKGWGVGWQRGVFFTLSLREISGFRGACVCVCGGVIAILSKQEAE